MENLRRKRSKKTRKYKRMKGVLNLSTVISPVILKIAPLVESQKLAKGVVFAQKDNLEYRQWEKLDKRWWW